MINKLIREKRLITAIIPVKETKKIINRVKRVTTAISPIKAMIKQ